MLRAVGNDSTEYEELRLRVCPLLILVEGDKSSPHGSPDPAAAHLLESPCPLAGHSAQTLQ